MAQKMDIATSIIVNNTKTNNNASPCFVNKNQPSSGIVNSGSNKTAKVISSSIVGSTTEGAGGSSAGGTSATGGGSTGGAGSATGSSDPSDENSGEKSGETGRKVGADDNVNGATQVKLDDGSTIGDENRPLLTPDDDDSRRSNKPLSDVLVELHQRNASPKTLVSQNNNQNSPTGKYVEQRLQKPDKDAARKTVDQGEREALLTPNDETGTRKPHIASLANSTSDPNLSRTVVGKRAPSLKSPQQQPQEDNNDDEDKPVLRVQFRQSKDYPQVCDGRVPNAQTAADSPQTLLSGSESDSGSSSSNESSSSSSSESDSTSSLEISEARPPDGGWGWVVVAAAFVVNLIADGITFSFGVIFVEFLNYFEQNRGTTAWVGSLFMAMPLLSGPVASFLTDRYGCRKVTIVGSLMASTGFIISSRANSMTVLCITFGIFAGFGLSLCYVASVVIVAYYFEKKRSLATGLAVCGSGIGTFIFAPFIQKLLDEYGWRGTTLILAGLFLNLAVCGALMRDLPWTHQKVKNMAKERKRKRHLKRKNKGSSADSFSVSNSTNTASALQPIVETHDETTKAAEDPPSTTTTTNNHLDSRLCSSLVNLPTYVRNGEKVPIEVIELLSHQKHVYDVLLANYPSLMTPSRSFSDSGRLNDVVNAVQQQQQQHEFTNRKKRRKLPTSKLVTSFPPPSHGATEVSSNGGNQARNKEEAHLWWLKRNDISPPHQNSTAAKPHHTANAKSPAFLKDLRVHRLSVTYRGAMLNINRYRLRASSCPDIYRNSMTTIAKEKQVWYAGLWDLWDLLVDMFDFSHFVDPKFCLFAISNFLLYTWYDVPYMYLTDHASSLGYSDGDFLISVIGIVNMVGEVILGWAGDRTWANASIIYAVCMFLCGLVTALVPATGTYWGLCVISGSFGFAIAANYSLTCIILVELITLDRFTNAYGLLLWVQGVANLIGPPLAGWLRDLTDNYDLSFYLAGVFIALSGLLLIILPITKKYMRYMVRRRSSALSRDVERKIEENELQQSPQRSKESKFRSFISSFFKRNNREKSNQSSPNHI